MKKEDIKPTNYRGSQKQYESVKQQIFERFGKEAAELYDPFSNCRTYNDWSSAGYIVNFKEKALHSVVVIEKKDKSGKIISTYPKTLCLFYQSQVSKVA